MRNKTHDDDPHAFCRQAIHRAYAAAADNARIGQIIKQQPDGHYDVLEILQVDMFQDGLRIVVK